MNLKKILKIAIIVLSVILVSIISFVGIFKKDTNQWGNIIPDYKLGMDLAGARNVTLIPVESTEQKYYDADGKEVSTTGLSEDQIAALTKKDVLINSEESKNWYNYKLVEEVMTKRLDQMDVADYVMSIDKDNGNINLSIPENSATTTVIQNLIQTGEFQIVDSDDGTVLLTNSDVKAARVGYSNSTTQTGSTNIYLSIQFNKEGKKKLKEISGTYKTVETNTNSTEEQTTENQETERKVTIKLDGSEILTTSFDNVIEDGVIQLSMGTATGETLNDTILSATNFALFINNNKLPVKYEVDLNQFVSSNITDFTNLFIIIGIVVAAILFAILIFRHRLKGLISSIVIIGYMAVLLLIIRYTNSDLSLDGIMAIGLSFVLAYIFDMLFLNKIGKKDIKEAEYKKEFNEAIKKFYLNMIIILVVAVVFCFSSWLPIYSFGIILFWGLTILFIYHELVTRYCLKTMIVD